MSRCNFCLRWFASAQSVRAHLRFCAQYNPRTRQSAAPRPQRALTDEEHIRRLFGSAPSSSRTPAAPATPAPRPAAPRPTPRPERDWAQEARAQETRRQLEVQREAEREQAAEQRRLAERTRSVIQHIKLFVVDCYFPSDPIPMEAIAEAKEEIERKLGTLPILELPVHELQQLGTALRDKIYRTYRTREVPISPVPLQAPTPMTVHHAPREVVMPMHKVLTGFFDCPVCETEYQLDLVPEKEAVCPDCRVALEELEEEDDDDDV